MPVYEYQCEACGHTFEELVLGEGKPVSCPECEGGVHKLLSLFTAKVPDDVCGRLPRGEQRELCTECREGGSACPMSA